MALVYWNRYSLIYIYYGKEKSSFEKYRQPAGYDQDDSNQVW